MVETNTPQEEIQPKPPVGKPSVHRRMVSWFFRLVWVLLFVFIAAVLSLRIPSVQHWTVSQTTTYLSKTLHTTVRIDTFLLDLTSSLHVSGFYVADQDGDTLLYSRDLLVYPNYLNLLRGSIQLDDVLLQDVQLNLTRKKGRYVNNAQFILDYLNPPSDKPGATKPVDLKIGNLHLRNISVKSDDEVAGKRLAASVAAVDLHTKAMNLPKQVVDVDRVSLIEPFFHIIDYPGSPMPDEPAKKPLFVKESAADTVKAAPSFFSVGFVEIRGGKFMLDNFNHQATEKIIPANAVNFRHLDVSNVDMNMHQFLFNNGTLTGAVDGISLREKSGFSITKLAASGIKITGNQLYLNDLQLSTPLSAVSSDSLILKFPSFTSFTSFEDSVGVIGELHKSNIALKDIMTFVPALMDQPFFQQNRDQVATIDANFKGYNVDNVNIPNFNIRLKRGFIVKGRLDYNNLNSTVDDPFRLNLRLDQLHANMKAVSELIPNFQLPPNFEQIGDMDFAGRFDGIPNSSVTGSGKLRSDIGDAELDLIFTIPDGKKTPLKYSGTVKLADFDLGKLTAEPDLGKITLTANIKDGRGLTKNDAHAALDAKIGKFAYKGYEYTNVNLTGEVDRKLFNGRLNTQDANVDFNFDGTVDFRKPAPIYHFTAAVRKLDLKTLRLSGQDLQFAGNVLLDLEGRTLSELRGSAQLDSLTLVKNQTENYTINQIKLSSTEDSVHEKHFVLKSEILNVNLDGEFILTKIPEALVKQFETNHQRLTADLHLPVIKGDTGLQRFKYNIQILDTKNLTKLIDPQLDTLRGASFTGVSNDLGGKSDWKFQIKRASYRNIVLNDVALDGNSYSGDGSGNFIAASIDVNKKQHFDDIQIGVQYSRDTINIDFDSHKLSSSFGLDTIQLKAQLLPQDSGAYKLSLTSSKIHILNDEWDVADGNYLFFGPNKFNANNFRLTSKGRTVRMESIGERGLKINLDSFSFDALNKVIKDDKYVLGGNYQVEASAGDIFSLKDLKIAAYSKNLSINGDDQGELLAGADAKDLKDSISSHIYLTHDSARLAAVGHFYPSATSVFPANYIDYTVDLNSFPFRPIQYLINSGISNTEGFVDANLRVAGPADRPDVAGKARLHNAAVTVDYIQTRLFVKDETVTISNTMIDASNASIYDSLGNRAFIQGGLTHDHFQNFGLDVHISSPHFSFLNTTQASNPLYYGKAVGAGDITFSGDFKQTDIKIQATAGAGTRVSFQLGREVATDGSEFIHFINKRTLAGKTVKDSVSSQQNYVTDLRGVNLDMELTVTPEAETDILFNPATKDNLRSWGEGGLQIGIDRTGELRMSGTYTVERGDYLFTLIDLVNKNFVLEKGGTISWTNSPYDAIINIDADYQNLITSPYNFIAEYIENDESARAEANRPTAVDLTLHLDGALLKPDISFDLAFPKITGVLKSYVEGKLRTLRQDQSELNRQVAGLVLFQSFLPSENGLVSGRDLSTGVINSATELLSSNLSTFLTNQLATIVSGVDIQVGYNNVQQYDKVNLDKSSSYQQYHVRLSSDLFKGRVTVSGGVGLENGAYQASDVFVGYDAVVDYYLTTDRRFRLRVSTVHDQVLDGRIRDKPAIGVRYRKEFDSFLELFKKRPKNS